MVRIEGSSQMRGGERDARSCCLSLEWVEVQRIRGLLPLLISRTSTLPEPTSSCSGLGGYCDRCDLHVGLDGLRVTGLVRDDAGALTVTVESAPAAMGCPSCGVLAHRHGRVEVRLVDAPSAGRPVTILWRKQRWVCPEQACPRISFVEQDEQIARPRALLTVPACRWAIGGSSNLTGQVLGPRR